MKTVFLPFILFFLLITVNSCDKRKIEKLHGTWEFIKKTDTGNHLYLITFDCDDVFYFKWTTPRINWRCDSTFYHDDSNYVKGTYEVNGKDLLLNGSYYTDSTYTTLKTGGCGKSGAYKIDKMLEWGKKDQFILYYKMEKDYYYRSETIDCE
jgi:hypothetical protein